MGNFNELQLADGTAIRFDVTAGDGTPWPDGAPGAGQLPDDAGESRHPEGPGAPDEEAMAELPDGMGPSVPVARGDGDSRVSRMAVRTVRAALAPVGSLLQEVHDAVLSAPQPPEEVTVTFGVQIGQDLKLGVVGGTGQAHLTIAASWRPGSSGD
ncbi:CU044_2847 family protein [Streptomyces sp. NPDC050161]|uniref:CU044_2847 family protein n=1 Tax=Streptomyces sp. NPDC050161 TaxID=3365604 RepID=UPI0037AB53AE